MATKKKAKRERVPAYATHHNTVDGAVSDAFSGAEELKDELQQWYDNLHENFQNGSKGEALQEAISAFEGLNQPDVPDEVAALDIEYSERTGRKGRSRAARRDTLTSMLQAAADAARNRANYLGELDYDEGAACERLDEYPDAPATEEDRDNLVTELEAFADECESAVSDLEGIEFPGMY